MDKATKVNYLYKIAMGEVVNLTAAEKRELSKYKVTAIGKPLTTKSNITEYVTAVDKGYSKAFYDWCLDHNKGDKRTKGGNAESLKSFNRAQGISVMFVGWLVWGLAIYWIFNGALAVGGCAILGAIVSFVLFRLKREAAGFTCLLLPVIIAVIAATR